MELSLKSRGRPGAALEGLEEGAVVRGRVKRVEKFGVFVELEGGATGGSGPGTLAVLSQSWLQGLLLHWLPVSGLAGLHSWQQLLAGSSAEVVQSQTTCCAVLRRAAPPPQAWRM